MLRLGVSASRISCFGTALNAQLRGIKVHRHTGRARYKSVLKSRRNFTGDWQLSQGANFERHQTDGHELEAFENFTRYMYDARNEHSAELSTASLADLPPMERFNQLIPLVAQRWKSDKKLSDNQRLKATLSLCECFGDYAELTGLTLADMTEDHQREFAQASEATLAYAERAVRLNDDAPAAVLRLAEIADVLREKLLRERCLATARGLANGLDRKVGQDVPVGLPERGYKPKDYYETDAFLLNPKWIKDQRQGRRPADRYPSTNLPA
jgi:hypothetical protein